MRQHWLPESGARDVRCGIPARGVRDEPDTGQGLAAPDSEAGADIQGLWAGAGGGHEGDTGGRGEEGQAADCAVERQHEVEVWRHEE